MFNTQPHSIPPKMQKQNGEATIYGAGRLQGRWSGDPTAQQQSICWDAAADAVGGSPSAFRFLPARPPEMRNAQ